MKKLLLTLGFLTFILLPLVVEAQRRATLFNPETGNRKIVEVGDPTAFDGGFLLETPTNNYILYWVNFLKTYNPEETQLTDEQLKMIPEEAWYQLTPQIYNEIPKDELNFGSKSQKIINISICRGDECLKFQKDLNFGYSVVSRYRTRLSSSMTSSQTTVPVASLETFDGHTLTMTDLGNLVFLTIEPGTDREEIVKCTTISSTSWATCTRGLAFYGTTETAVAANQKAHNAGSIVVMSNVHYVYEQLPDKDTNQTLTGLWTFNQYPVFSTGTTVPTSSAQFATKYYVDTVGAGGFTSLNASTTKGLETYGTAPETVGINASSTRGTTFDTNGALYQVTSSTKGISSDTNGLYIDGVDAITWTGDQTFSTTTQATSTITALQSTTSTITGLNFGNATSTGVTKGIPSLVSGVYPLCLPIGFIPGLATHQMSTANRVYTYPIFIPHELTVTKIAALLSSGSTAGRYVGFGIYNMTGTSLLIDSGPIEATADTILSKTLVTAVYLKPGPYLLAWTGNNTALTLAGNTGGAAATDMLLNFGNNYFGYGGNASTNGQLPSTLGTITTSTANIASIIITTE